MAGQPPSGDFKRHRLEAYATLERPMLFLIRSLTKNPDTYTTAGVSIRISGGLAHLEGFERTGEFSEPCRLNQRTHSDYRGPGVSVKSMSLSTYPFFHCCGSPRELGRQHGEQARTQVQGFLEYLQRSLNFTPAVLREQAARFEPLFRGACEHLLDEIGGLAEGANIQRYDALALQLRGELAAASHWLPDEACTAFAIARARTADGCLWIGQNSDNPPELMDFAYVLRLVPTSGPRILMWTFGGMIGYHGLNDCGVAQFANALGGGPAWKFALAHYPLKRRILEQRDLSGVRHLLRTLAVCSNGNYVLCDRAEVTDIELTTDGPFEIVSDNPNRVIHSNHFLNLPHALADNDAQSLPDSKARLYRLQELVDSTNRPLCLDDLKHFLRDHAGHPSGVCRHAHEGPDHPLLSSRGQTIASLIADPDHGLLHIARGTPCSAPYVTYRLHDA